MYDVRCNAQKPPTAATLQIYASHRTHSHSNDRQTDREETHYVLRITRDAVGDEHGHMRSAVLAHALSNNSVHTKHIIRYGQYFCPIKSFNSIISK